MLGIFLIVATFLKVATMYLAFYTMIPIRTGVVRDIRNQINKKITQLPLSFSPRAKRGYRPCIRRRERDRDIHHEFIGHVIQEPDPDRDLSGGYDRYQLATYRVRLDPAAVGGLRNGTSRQEIETEILGRTATMGIPDEPDRGDIRRTPYYQGL